MSHYWTAVPSENLYTERQYSLLVTESLRRQFVGFSAVAVLRGWVVAALLGPPDPVIQLVLGAGFSAIGIGGTYVVVYHTTSTIHIRLGDVFRWVVSTAFFILGIEVLIQFVFPTAGTIPWPFDLVLNLYSAVLAAVVVWSDRIPWPGDP